MSLVKPRETFSLIEIIIVLVIIATLSTLMIPAAFNILERSKNTACEANQKILLGALERYGMEHIMLPASLSQLREKHIEWGWVKLMSESGSWKIRLAYAVADFSLEPIVYAQPTDWLQEFIDLPKPPTCPADETPEDYSYGLSSEFAGQPRATLTEADLDDIVIGDSDTATFDFPTARHTKHGLSGSRKFAITITSGSEIIYFPELPPAGPPVGSPDPDDDCEVERHKCKCAFAQTHGRPGCGCANDPLCRADQATCIKCD